MENTIWDRVFQAVEGGFSRGTRSPPSVCPLFIQLWDRMYVFNVPPNAISKLFCFPGLVLTTAGFILAGVSQKERSLSWDFGRAGCARPHSAANQMGSVLPVQMTGGSGGLLETFHAPLSHLSRSTAILLLKMFCRGVVLFSWTNMPTLVCFEMYKPSRLVRVVK